MGHNGQHPSDDIRFSAAPDLPGVTLLDAYHSTKLWRVFHETYTCCVIPVRANALDAASYWRYRRTSQVARPGDIMLIEPGEVHDAWKITAPGTYFVMQFSPRLVASIARDLGLRSLPHLQVCQVRDRPLAFAMESLRRSYRGDATPLQRQVLLARAVQSLLHGYAEPSVTRRLADVGARHLGLVRDLLVEHYAERITLDDLVALTGVSRFHLIRSFRKRFGVPPHRFQVLVRISRAQRRLRAGWPPALAAVGFADQSHLTREFRRVMGVTPAAYQRQVLPPACGHLK